MIASTGQLWVSGGSFGFLSSASAAVLLSLPAFDPGSTQCDGTLKRCAVGRRRWSLTYWATFRSFFLIRHVDQLLGDGTGFGGGQHDVALAKAPLLLGVVNGIGSSRLCNRFSSLLSEPPKAISHTCCAINSVAITTQQSRRWRLFVWRTSR